MSDLLVIKMNPGIKLQSEVMDRWRTNILKMKETGVVVLPWFLDVVVVPEDVVIKFEEDQNG